MRPMWSGSISFGLVNIPIRLYSATNDESLSFNQLHKEDLSPVRYAKICRADGRELSKDDIVRGYEYRKGEYIVLDDEDFERANSRRIRVIDILSFAQENEVDTTYFEKPYFLEPDKGADKPYALLRESLKRTGKVGIGKFVLKTREYLGIIKPQEDIIVLNQLRFHSEMRNSGELKRPDASQVDDRELQIAEALINQLTEAFEPERYRDEYTAELKRVIDEKAEGRVPAEIGKAPEPTPVIDLMSVLKASLEQAKEKAA